MSIELQTGNQVDVTSSSDAELYAGMFGEENYILRTPLELKMENPNTLSIGPGNALQNGRHIRLKGVTELTIPSGIQAQKRSHIAVIRTTITRDDETMVTVEKSEGIVLSGEPTMDGSPEDPQWIEGNLLKGDTIADFPIAKVVTDGINAGDPTPMYELMSSHVKAWDSLSRSVNGLTDRNYPFVTDLRSAQIGYNAKEDMVFLRVGMPGSGSRIVDIRPSGIHFVDEVTGKILW